MATLQENIDSMNLAFQTHMKNKNPGVDAQTILNIEEYALAYATAIANAIGAGTSSVPVGDYLKKSGGADGVMSGKLTANSGFEAGFSNSKKIETTDEGVLIFGKQDISGDLFINNGSIKSNALTTLSKHIIEGVGSTIALGNENIHNNLKGVDFLFSTSITPSLFSVNETRAAFKGNTLLHEGNANLSTIDWAMKNANVQGALTVVGVSTFSNSLLANYGFQGGVGNAKKIEAISNGVEIFGDLFIGAGSQIRSRYNDNPVLEDLNNGSTTINASDGDLYLGYQNTNKNILSANLHNYNGTRLLLDKFGKANLNWGFEGGKSGDKKIETHDQGVTVYGSFQIDDDLTSIKKGADNTIKIENGLGYVDIGAKSGDICELNTDKNKFVFNARIDAFNRVGIQNSQTRIENNKLLLNDNHYLISLADGVKHYGNSWMTGKIGTESFSTGFAGNGWQIDQDAKATFTDLVVRRRLKVYEFEVQKISSVNGSFWVSANCSAATVTKL